MIRHGITQGNLEGKYIGSTDLPLCEPGREEIETLVDTCEYPHVQKVYCSPLKRAVETADIIYPDTFLQKVDALKEYDFGVFENQSLERLKKRMPLFKNGWKVIWTLPRLKEKVKNSSKKDWNLVSIKFLWI